MGSRRLSESERIERLNQLGILDTPRDRLFQSLAEQALVLMPGTSIAAISLVDIHRQWFKSIVGLDATETPRDVAFCAHTIQTDCALVVTDATQDQRFVDNPLVTSSPRIRFYTGIRLMDGVGALCVIGTEPRKVTDHELSSLVKLAQYVDILLLSHGTLHNLQGTEDAREGNK